jgi:methionine-rich copper-binding protein CopC
MRGSDTTHRGAAPRRSLQHHTGSRAPRSVSVAGRPLDQRVITTECQPRKPPPIARELFTAVADQVKGAEGNRGSPDPYNSHRCTAFTPSSPPGAGAGMSPMEGETTMRTTRYLALGVAIAAAALLDPAIASAHDWVVSTTPTQNSTGPAPTQVSITYNEPVTNEFASVAGPDNAVWSSGPLTGSGATYTLPLRPSPPPGQYTVWWGNTAGDGDSIHGHWTFTVA